MTRQRETLDRAAGSAARRLLGWATTRRSASKQIWIQALGSEIDAAETGWSPLAWALGAIRTAVDRMDDDNDNGAQVAVRLRWIGSAGGLGGASAATAAASFAFAIEPT